MTIADMGEFRKKKQAEEDSSDYDGQVCRHCGEAWFHLGGEGAAVCLDEEGCITGYAGYLYCSACGRPHQG
jgi:hypothetical protein